MNERIDELMMQSGARLDAWGRVDLDDFQYKKFAELIIRECMSLTENHNQYWTQKSGSESIAEHFGVK